MNVTETAEDRMLGCRYELKYLVSEQVADAIERQVSTWLLLDDYSRKFPSGYYSIASAYLDSSALQLYKESCDGKSNRYKLRIRTYNDLPQTPCFFEIKRRLNTVIVKSRVKASKADAEVLLGSFAPPAGTRLSDAEAFQQFQFYKSSLKAVPLVHVLYERKAYESAPPNRVRVTFDRNMRCCRSNAAVPVIGTTPWQTFLPNKIVLEFKFTGRYPAWILNLTRAFNLKQQSVSKYAHSIQRTGIADEPPVLRRTHATLS